MTEKDSKPVHFDDLPDEVQIKITLEKEIQKCDVQLGVSSANGPHAGRTRSKFIREKKAQLETYLAMLPAGLLRWIKHSNGTFTIGKKAEHAGLINPVAAYLQPIEEITTTAAPNNDNTV